jgi:hypothetical protein
MGRELYMLNVCNRHDVMRRLLRNITRSWLVLGIQAQYTSRSKGKGRSICRGKGMGKGKSMGKGQGKSKGQGKGKLWL